MMRSVPVNAPSGQYEVKIGSGILSLLGQAVAERTKAKKCMVVCGENVSRCSSELFDKQIYKSRRGSKKLQCQTVDNYP